MPYALFRYDPEEEFELRRQVTLLFYSLVPVRASESGAFLSPSVSKSAMRSQRRWRVVHRPNEEQGCFNDCRHGAFGTVGVIMPLVELVPHVYAR